MKIHSADVGFVEIFKLNFHDNPATSQASVSETNVVLAWRFWLWQDFLISDGEIAKLSIFNEFESPSSRKFLNDNQIYESDLCSISTVRGRFKTKINCSSVKSIEFRWLEGLGGAQSARISTKFEKIIENLSRCLFSSLFFAFQCVRARKAVFKHVGNRCRGVGWFLLLSLL